MFITSPVARWLWITIWLMRRRLDPEFSPRSCLYGGTCATSCALTRSCRWRPTCTRSSSPGALLSRLAVSGGQFLQWRFLAPGLWWHAHPYSLSALPRPPYLRVTIKGLGDQSRAVARLKPGTRVIVEGPYGTFTRHRLMASRVVLIGAGVGVTPLRALLEDLPVSTAVTMVVRARTLRARCPRPRTRRTRRHAVRGDYHELCGSRDEVRLDERTLRGLVGSLHDADVYVCGPSDFTDAVVATARRLGARPDRLHFETFSF